MRDSSMLKRCYRAGCSSIKIVVPGEEFGEVVRHRLDEVLSKRRNVVVTASILRWFTT